MTNTQIGWAEMFSLLMQAKTMLAGIPLLGGIAAIIHFREKRWIFRKRKSKKFRNLLKGDSWQDASNLDFQYAMEDAYGRTIPKAQFAFIATRDRATRLMADVFKASMRVNFNAAGDGWSPAESKSVESMRWHSRVSLGIGFVFAILSCLTLACLLVMPSFIILEGLSYCLLFCVVGFARSSQFDAALRLVVELDRLYPASRPIPKHLRVKRPPTKPKSSASKSPKAPKPQSDGASVVEIVPIMAPDAAPPGRRRA